MDYYVKGRGMIIVPKRTLSDPCEHLFSRIRNWAWLTNNVTTKAANAAICRENVLNKIKISTKGSYGQAPALFDVVKNVKKKRW